VRLSHNTVFMPVPPEHNDAKIDRAIMNSKLTTSNQTEIRASAIVVSVFLNNICNISISARTVAFYGSTSIR